VTRACFSSVEELSYRLFKEMRRRGIPQRAILKQAHESEALSSEALSGDHNGAQSRSDAQHKRRRDLNSPGSGLLARETYTNLVGENERLILR
jgi:hypothetical protein